MINPVELFVGLRYLRAKRRTRFVSFITLISLIGIALGVAALIVILSVMNGFEGELRSRLLSMSAHGFVTGSDGVAKLSAELAAADRKGEMVVVLDVFGKKITSKAFELPADGGVRIRFSAAWRPAGLRARFDGIAAGGENLVSRVYRAGLSDTPANLPGEAFEFWQPNLSGVIPGTPTPDYVPLDSFGVGAALVANPDLLNPVRLVHLLPNL